MPEHTQNTPITIIEPVSVPPAFTGDFRGFLADLVRQGYTNVFDPRPEPTRVEKLDQLIHADVALEDADEWYAELADLMPPCETISAPSPDCTKWSQAGQPARRPFPRAVVERVEAGLTRYQEDLADDSAFRMFTPAEVAAGVDFPCDWPQR